MDGGADPRQNGAGGDFGGGGLGGGCGACGAAPPAMHATRRAPPARWRRCRALRLACKRARWLGLAAGRFALPAAAHGSPGAPGASWLSAGASGEGCGERAAIGHLRRGLCTLEGAELVLGERQRAVKAGGRRRWPGRCVAHSCAAVVACAAEARGHACLLTASSRGMCPGHARQSAARVRTVLHRRRSGPCARLASRAHPAPAVPRPFSMLVAVLW